MFDVVTCYVQAVWAALAPFLELFFSQCTFCTRDAMCSTLLLAKSAQVPNAQAWYTKKLGLRVWAHATVLLCLLPFSGNVVRLRRKKENNVIEKIKVVISNCCSGKGSRLWITILGYVAA